MLNCDCTYSTMHQFHDSYCEQDENTNMVGIYPENKIENFISRFPTNLWTQFFISETVDISCKKPDIESIMSIYSYTQIVSQRVIKTPVVTKNGCPDYDTTNSECSKLTGKKLIIEGILKQKLVYTAAVTEQTLHSAYFSIPFSAFIIVSQDTLLSQKFKIDIIVENVYASRVSQRSIFKNTSLFIRANPIY